MGIFEGQEKTPLPGLSALPSNHQATTWFFTRWFYFMAWIQSLLGAHTKLAPHEYWYMEIEIFWGFAEILVKDKI